MIGTALAVASMAGGLLNNIRAKNAANEAAAKLAKRKNELDLEYKYDYNMDFLNTPMAKSAISLLSQKYIENARKLAQANVITGASDEKAVAGAAEMQKPFINTITGLAGYGQQRQDSIRYQKLSADQNMFGLEYNADRDKAAQLQNAAGNAAGAAGGFIMADSLGAFGGADDWLKKTFGNWGGKIAAAGTTGN